MELDRHRQETTVQQLLGRFLADEGGATAIEYALIAGGICLVIIVVVQSLGTSVQGRYQAVADGLRNP